MKKITLLFLIVCFGQIYGMEQPEQGRYIGSVELTPEVQVMIIQALNSYNNLDDVIKAIKAMSLTNTELNAVVNDMYGSPKGFKKLVHTLADKFNLTTQTVAEKFGTSPAAKEYIRLAKELKESIRTKNINGVKDLIGQGADINPKIKPPLPPLWYFSIVYGHVAITKLLLDNGMDINQKDEYGQTALQYTEKHMQFYITECPGEYIEIVNNLRLIKELLENASKK